MARFIFGALVCSLGLLLVLGQEGCVWELKKNQGLKPESFDAGASFSAHLPKIIDPAECWTACCDQEDCQLALIETTTSDCFLINCMQNNQDVCVLEENSEYDAYRETQESRTEESSVYCRFQAVKGRCRASFPRFYYDVTSQTCENFTYGGCGGNNNNFGTQEECETSCSGVTGDVLIDSRTTQKRRVVIPENNEVDQPELTSKEFEAKCQAEPQVGRCRASIPRYYYKSGTCLSFTYGGCGGNENNYVSEEECMKTCTVKVVESEKSSEEESKEYQEACVVPSESGPCRAYFSMFYFDANTQSCHEFTYGGCKGNQNRYKTEEECMSRCARNEASFDEHGHGHRHGHWTAGFFLVATLAIMCVVLLAGLILITVRRAQRRHLITLDDKQELLPEWHATEEDCKNDIH